MDGMFHELTELLRTLPGIGPRAASRIVLSLLNRSQEDLNALGEAIAELKSTVLQCTECFNVSNQAICSICRDSKRDAKSILVVEHITDLLSVERAGIWRGYYHVLGGALSPVDKVGPEHIRFRELGERVDRICQQAGGIELVIATNPTSAGEMTAHYIRDMFHHVPGVRITRLARGLATGTHLEYADETTLRYALESRK
jgi:recombination protein RecR